MLPARTKMIMLIACSIGIAAGSLTYLASRSLPRLCSPREPRLAAPPVCSASSSAPDLNTLLATATITRMTTTTASSRGGLEDRWQQSCEITEVTWQGGLRPTQMFGAWCGMAPVGCRAAGPGSMGRWRRVRGGILPTGPEEPPLGPRASAVRRGRTGRASREPDVRACVRPGFRECRPRPSTFFSACLYDGQCRPFLRLRDGTHPLAVGPVKPWPLIQARQIRPAAPVGARKTGTRPTDRFARQPERRQPNRRSGRDQAPDPTRPSRQGQGSRAGSNYPQSPCRIGAQVSKWVERLVGTQINLICAA